MFIIVYHCLSIPVVSCFDEPKNYPRYSKMGSPRWPYRRSEALWWLGCAFHAMPAECVWDSQALQWIRAKAMANQKNRKCHTVMMCYVGKYTCKYNFECTMHIYIYGYSILIYPSRAMYPFSICKYVCIYLYIYVCTYILHTFKKWFIYIYNNNNNNNINNIYM
jgi:hypothetical protein